MTSLQACALVLGLNALLLLLLALHVSRQRIRLRIAHGDGGQQPMKAAIRAHANGIEHAPLFTLCLLVMALLGSSTGTVLALGGTFTLARLGHAWGMLGSNFPARQFGAALSYLAEGVAVVVLLQLALNS